MKILLLFLISFSAHAQFGSDVTKKIDIIRPATTTTIIASGTFRVQDGSEGTTSHVLYSSGTEGETTWAALPPQTQLVSETLTSNQVAFGNTTNVISSSPNFIFSDDVLQVSGTITSAHLNASSTVTAITYYGDGSNLTGIPSGQVSETLDSTFIAFGSGGSTISGSPDLTFNDTTKAFDVSGTVTANSYFGDGSNLTGIPSGQVSETLDSTYIAFGSGSNVISGSPDLTFNDNTDSFDVSGTVTANTFFGDGSNLTGIISGGGGSASTTIEFDESQASHGFIVGHAIYHNGTDYQKAQADDASTLAEHVVIRVEDANNFTAAKFGQFIISSHTLGTAGQHYFLSASTAGGSSTVEAPNYSSPIYKVIDANTIEVEVYRPSITAAVGVSSDSVTYEFLVGNTSDVAEGSANFDTIAGALSYASNGNKIILLPRTFSENVSIDKSVLIEGYGSFSIISGTTDFVSGSSGSMLMKVKLNGDASIESGVRNVIVTDAFISNTATFSVASESFNSVNIWQEE